MEDKKISKWTAARMRAKRHNRIEIKVSDEELETVRKRAEKANLRVGLFVRRMAVQGEMKFYDLSKLHDLYRSFYSIGDTLNQIAKVVNSTNSVYKKDIEEMQDRFRYFEKKLKMHLRELEPEVI